MAGTRLGEAYRPLCTLFNVGTVSGLTDGQLLDRYLQRGGEAAELAFAALVERHGKRVLRVCRTILVDHEEARDAFQATFLVLVRRAKSIRARDSVAGWLHGVALRVASSSRASRNRRLGLERRFALMERPTESVDNAEINDRRRVILEELDRLPERYRIAVVLCDLEGLSQEQAASQLDWPVGTVKSRLFRARERLRDRLTRRGLAPSASASLSFLGSPSILSKSLTDATLSVAKGFAVNHSGPEMMRGPAEILAQGVLSMLKFKLMLKSAMTTVLVGSVAAGTVLFAQRKAIPDPTPTARMEKSQIAFEIISLGMSGLEWRDTLNSDLHFLDQVDNGTVWTLAGRDEINRVLALAPGASYLPKPTAFEGESVQVDNEEQTKYVSNLEIIRSKGGGVAFKPGIKTLSHGKRIELRGNLRSDGILVKATLEFRQILAFTIQTITTEGLNSEGKIARLRGQVQVPDFRIDKVEGEWLIPTDGALLVSLGIHEVRVPGLFRPTATFERLFLIKAFRIPEEAIAKAKLPASIRPKAN